MQLIKYLIHLIFEIIYVDWWLWWKLYPKKLVLIVVDDKVWLVHGEEGN
jgi:hypothetical protein